MYPFCDDVANKAEGRIAVSWADFRHLDNEVYLNDINIQFYMR